MRMLQGCPINTGQHPPPPRLYSIQGLFVEMLYFQRMNGLTLYRPIMCLELTDFVGICFQPFFHIILEVVDRTWTTYIHHLPIQGNVKSFK